MSVGCKGKKSKRQCFKKRAKRDLKRHWQGWRFCPRGNGKLLKNFSRRKQHNRFVWHGQSASNVSNELRKIKPRWVETNVSIEIIQMRSFKWELKQWQQDEREDESYLSIIKQMNLTDYFGSFLVRTTQRKRYRMTPKFWLGQLNYWCCPFLIKRSM